MFVVKKWVKSLRSRWVSDREWSRRIVCDGIAIGIAVAVVVINVRHVVPDSIVELDIAPFKFLESIFHTYSSVDLGERVNGSTVAYLPMAVVYSALRCCGISMLIVQRIWFAGLLAGSATGMIRLYGRWWSDGTSARALAAGLIYALSPYVLFNLQGSSAFLVPYAGLPWLAYDLVTYCRGPTSLSKVRAVAVGGVLGVGVNPPLTFLMLLAAFIMALGELWTSRAKLDEYKRIAGIGLAIAVVSLWWIVPFVETVRGGGVAAYFVTDPLSEGAAASSFSAVMSQTGLWPLYQGWDGIPYYPSYGFFAAASTKAALLLAPVLAILGIERRWNSRRGKVLALLLVLSIPLAVSIYPVRSPGLTGILYQWLYSHVLLFRAFRSNYKWVALIAFVYALVIPQIFGPSEAKTREGTVRATKIKYYVLQALSPLVALILVVYAAPFFQQRVFYDSYAVGSIPKYWVQAANYLDRNTTPGRVLFLPVQGFSLYKWGNPYGDIAPSVLSRAEVTFQNGLPLGIQAQQLAGLIQSAPTDPSVPFEKLLYLFGIRFVVQRNDANWKYYGDPSPPQMAKFLTKQNALRKVATFGLLDIYEVRNSPRYSALAVARNVDHIAYTGGIESALKAWTPNSLAQFSNVGVSIPGIKSVTASSVWNGLVSELGPYAAFEGRGLTGWVPKGRYGIGQWWQANFSHTTRLYGVLIKARQDGVDALPTVLRISTGNMSERVVMGRGGIVDVNLGGHAARTLRITILASGKGGPNVGLSRISIYGVPSLRVIFPPLSRRGPATYIDSAQGTEARLMMELVARASRTVTVTGQVVGNALATTAQLESYLHPIGVSSIQASGRYGGMAAYDPLWAIAGDPHMYWVPNASHGHQGRWIQLNFSRPRWVGKIGLVPREDGVDPIVSEVEVTTRDTRSEAVQRVRYSADGVGSITVDRRVKSIRLTIVAVTGGGRSYNPGFRLQLQGVGVSRRYSALVPQALVVNGRIQQLSGIPAALGDRYAAGLGTERSFRASVKLRAGVNTISTSSSLSDVADIRLQAGNARSAILQPIAFDVNGLSYCRPKLPGGYRYVMLNQAFDKFWTLQSGEKKVSGPVMSNGYAMVWPYPKFTGRVCVRYSSGWSPTLWIGIWASCLGALGLVWVVLRRRISSDKRER